ncbi:MAG: lysophospholipid acyltransferase family protein [Spirochaetes bacterium]|nr:lysophospholipid acyltransferase family protein [Spirochaetota bacterium]
MPRKFIKHFSEYFFLFYLYRLARMFPLDLLLKVATLLGKCLYHINTKHRQRALKNLSLSFPEKTEEERETICKNVYINLCKIFTEFIFLPRINESFVRKRVRVQGEEHLRQALKGKRGILAITGHLGNWELLGTIMVKLGYPLDAIYQPMKNPFSDRLFYNIRARSGMGLISTDNSLRGSLKALKQNHLLGLIADQDAGRSGVFVDFFGRPASTARGPAVFAVKTKSPMLFFALIREKNNAYSLNISPPLKVRDTGQTEDDIHYNTKLWSDRLEKWVRQYPDQWFWVHRKWHSKKRS